MGLARRSGNRVLGVRKHTDASQDLNVFIYAYISQKLDPGRSVGFFRTSPF